MKCKKCDRRFSSGAAHEAHVGKRFACLNPALIPVLETAADGQRWKWAAPYDHMAVIHWHAERVKLSRLEPADFDAWTRELSQT